MELILALLLSGVLARMAQLGALALWMRWQAARDRRRHDTVAEITAHLPCNGVVELDDTTSDGRRLRLRIITRSIPQDHDA